MDLTSFRLILFLSWKHSLRCLNELDFPLNKKQQHRCPEELQLGCRSAQGLNEPYNSNVKPPKSVSVNISRWHIVHMYCIVKRGWEHVALFHASSYISITLLFVAYFALIQLKLIFLNSWFINLNAVLSSPAIRTAVGCGYRWKYYCPWLFLQTAAKDSTEKCRFQLQRCHAGCREGSSTETQTGGILKAVSTISGFIIVVQTWSQ